MKEKREFILSLLPEETILLVRDGKSDYSIVTSRDASPSEQHGVRELQRFLGEISGAMLPIVTDEGEPPQRMILVGKSRHLKTLHVAVDWDELSDEGFVMKTVGPHVVLAGGRLRGTMYAVYAFLEEKLGCRWFTATISRIPRNLTIEVENFDETQKPAFEYREPFFTEAFDGDWCARNRCNSSHATLDEQRGGKVTYHHFVHTFDDLIPPSFFDTHPEYFPLIDGKRVNGYVQRCLTNPDVLRMTTEKVLEWIRERPDATLYSVSQNDTGNWCRCPDCQAVADEEGSQAGLYLRFVNAVAEEVEKYHPDKLIDTLAYQFTEEPPKITKPRRNVRVRLCPISCCEAHPYEQCSAEPNVKFVQNLKAWAEITDTLYIWHYNTNFAHYLLPFPDFYELEASTRLYKRSGVRGIFFEGGYAPGGGAENAELRSYVLAKLLWNPDVTVDPLVNDFLQGVYGKAGRPLRDYFDLLHAKVKDPDQHFYIFSPPTMGYLSSDLIAEADKLFDEAEGLAQGDTDLLDRVKKARMPVRYTKLMQGLPENTDHETFRAFMADVRRYGIQQLREGRALEQWEKEQEEKLK